MPEESFHIENPPIVEVVLDIDCDFQPNFELRAAQSAILEAFKTEYPQHDERMLHETQIRQEKGAPPKVQLGRNALHSIQLFQEDRKQLVQFRENGYSFNRLAPYECLNTYLPEIERTWGVFNEIVRPVAVRRIALRTINRMLLPLKDGGIKLEDYFKTAPKLPPECALQFTGFLNQHMAVDPRTGYRVDIVLTTQNQEQNHLPVIFDINAFAAISSAISTWKHISDVVYDLRVLKNSVFYHTLTEKCLNLYSQSDS
jgi:uncharacterized protein (TIGR04255 family)